MKSTNEQLCKRGMVSDSELYHLKHMNFEQRVKMLQANEPCLRSAAAISLKHDVDKAADMLLKQLKKEEALYTRIAICEDRKSVV